MKVTEQDDSCRNENNAAKHDVEIWRRMFSIPKATQVLPIESENDEI